jgi:thiol-disulfide isomerase/thioredoxin
MDQEWSLRMPSNLRNPLTNAWVFCLTILSLITSLITITPVYAADPPPIKLALSFKPVHADIVYDTPEEKEFDKCKVEFEKGAINGWIVVGPAGLPIRRFVDINGDNLVDQWRYYSNGMEVYRDIDSNFNKKVDQSRWLNLSGTRWAIDENEDGKIDRWQQISAEEASREAITALATQDPQRLGLIFVSPSEMDQIGIHAEFGKAIQKEASDMDQKFKQIAGKLEKTSRWVRFDSSMLMPNLIPKDEGRANRDLQVYENVMAIVETNGKTGFVQVGEMVKVNDCWKLTQWPKILEGDTLQVSEGGILMQPVASAIQSMSNSNNIDPELQQMVDQLQKLDQSPPAAGSPPAQITAYNRQRVQLIQRLIATADTPAEKKQWQQQLVDGIAAAIQTGSYTEGIPQLQALEKSLAAEDPLSTLVPYTIYRRMLAEYSVRLQDPNSNNEQRQQVQDWWLKQLETYAESYGTTPDAADAMLQLGMTYEFIGKTTDASKWYKELVKSHPNSNQAQRGKGAIARLGMTGKPLDLSGTRYGSPGTLDIKAFKGKVTLVIFWASWCQPHTDDLPQLQKMYADFKAQGFEIIGVNLDSEEQTIRPYLQQHRVAWPQIFEPGGLESRLAEAYGIFSLPTMFLVDRAGVVQSRGTSVEELKDQLPKLLEKQ